MNASGESKEKRDPRHKSPLLNTALRGSSNRASFKGSSFLSSNATTANARIGNSFTRRHSYSPSFSLPSTVGLPGVNGNMTSLRLRRESSKLKRSSFRFPHGSAPPKPNPKPESKKGHPRRLTIQNLDGAMDERDDEVDENQAQMIRDRARNVVLLVLRRLGTEMAAVGAHHRHLAQSALAAKADGKKLRAPPKLTLEDLMRQSHHRARAGAPTGHDRPGGHDGGLRAGAGAGAGTGTGLTTDTEKIAARLLSLMDLMQAASDVGKETGHERARGSEHSTELRSSPADAESYTNPDDSVQFPEEASALATLTRRHLDPARVRPEYVEEAVQLLQELSPRLLSALPGTALTGLITGEEMCVVAAQAGDALLERGRPGEGMLLLLRGAVDVEYAEGADGQGQRHQEGDGAGHRARVGRGRWLGEELMCNTTAVATSAATCASDCVLLLVDRSGYLKMMKQHVVLPAADSVAELRQNLLPQPLRETLVSSVGMRTLLRDEVLVQRGQRADLVYVLLSGKLRDGALHAHSTEETPPSAPGQRRVSVVDGDVSDGHLPPENPAGTIGPGICLGVEQIYKTTVTGDRRCELIAVPQYLFYEMVQVVESKVLTMFPGAAARRAQTVREALCAALELRTPQQIEALVEAMAGLRFFKPLKPQICRDVCKVLRYAVAAPGQTMIRQGDHGDMMFVILAGDAQVYAVTDNGDRSELGTLPAGMHFGELALMRDMPHAATVVAKGAVELAVLDRAHYASLLKHEHSKISNEFTDFLCQVAIMRECQPLAVQKLIYRVTHHVYEKDKVLLRQGGPPSSLFVIKSGSVRMMLERAGKEDAGPVVTRQLAGSHLARAHSHASGEQSLLRSGTPAKTTVMIAQLGRGEVFGDVAVLASRADALTQPFTVITQTECEVIEVEASDLAGLGDTWRATAELATRQRYLRFLERAEQGVAARMHLPLQHNASERSPRASPSPDLSNSRRERGSMHEDLHQIGQDVRDAAARSPDPLPRLDGPSMEQLYLRRADQWARVHQVLEAAAKNVPRFLKLPRVTAARGRRDDAAGSLDATLHRYQGGSVARVNHASQPQRPDPATTQQKHILSASAPQPLQSSPPGIPSHEFISVDKDSLLDAAIGEMSHPLLASLRRGSPRDWSPSKTSPTTTRKDPSDAQSRWKQASCSSSEAGLEAGSVYQKWKQQSNSAGNTPRNIKCSTQTRVTGLRSTAPLTAEHSNHESTRFRLSSASEALTKLPTHFSSRAAQGGASTTCPDSIRVPRTVIKPHTLKTTLNSTSTTTKLQSQNGESTHNANAIAFGGPIMNDTLVARDPLPPAYDDMESETTLEPPPPTKFIQSAHLQETPKRVRRSKDKNLCAKRDGKPHTSVIDNNIFSGKVSKSIRLVLD